MIIAQITDTHLAGADATDPVFSARVENLRQCIADINRLDPAPDAIIHTGDMTHHGRAAEFDQARALLAALVSVRGLYESDESVIRRPLLKS